MKTVLITGSNGFIGKYVAEHFKEHDWYVIGLGRKEHATDPKCVHRYIQCQLGTEKTPTVLKDMVHGQNIDAIVHLAADMRKGSNEVDVIAANCVGLQQLLDFAKNAKIQTFLQLSSLPVIGSPKFHPITEDHPTNPQTIYHITKCMDEQLLQFAMDHSTFRTAWFRISSPLGIGMNEQTIFPTFVRQALANEPICILGKGLRKQNYIYVKDITKILYQAVIIPEVKGCYNLTGDLLLSNLQLAQKCISRTGSFSQIQFVGKEDPEENNVWDASLKRLNRDFINLPKTTMDEIIQEYATYVLDKKRKEKHA